MRRTIFERLATVDGRLAEGGQLVPVYLHIGRESPSRKPSRRPQTLSREAEAGL
jgi:hypothetical protein